MSSQFEQAYRVTSRTTLDQSFWNSVFRNVDQRLIGVEDKKASFEEAEQQLLDIGLKRINETIQPAAEKIQRMSELGFMIASSDDHLQPQEDRDLSVHLIKNELADIFAPSPFVALVRRSTPDAYAIGRLITYDREAQRLDIQIVSTHGDMGPHDDWDIAALAGTVMAMVDALEESRALHAAVVQDRTIVATDKLSVQSERNITQQQRLAAEQARLSADAALADFNNRYMGPHTKPPQNAALGALYLDISQVPNVVKVLTKTGWNPTVTVSVGGSRQQTYVSQGEAGPYKVDGGFSNGAVSVNGVTLYAGHGVSFDSETATFTLDTAPKAGSIIAFEGYLANDAVDIYTKQEADNRFGKTEADNNWSGENAFHGRFSVTDRGLEVGKIDGTANAAYIDFHTSTTPVDYNARIRADGDTDNGDGTLQYEAASHVFHNSVRVQGTLSIGTGDTKLQSDGNIRASLWGGGHLYQHIENRAAAFADTRKNACVTNSRFAGWTEQAMPYDAWYHLPSGYVVTSFYKIQLAYAMGARQPQLYIANRGWFQIGAW